MVPLPRFKRQCDEQFVVHEEYPLTILEARSRVSHNHYFASLHEAWSNLPEDVAARFPSAEHLRKWALVEAGYSTEKNFVCESKDHARRLALFARSVDTFSVITLSGNIVRIFEAKSQSAAAMGAEEFQKSKTAVLDIVAGLLGTKTSELKKEGARHFRPEPARRGQ